jgi:Mg2+ and Co2+ transporter CorA
MDPLAQRRVHSYVVSCFSQLLTLCPPLQFLTGLWGMNFNPDLGNMPELEWEHGYKMFWCGRPHSPHPPHLL